MTVLSATVDSLVVAEVFGPTLQGEGPSLGRRAAFVRLGGCNLHCSWCDTPYTWDASRYDLRTELTRMSVMDIVTKVHSMDPHVTVITGGEPLLWQRQPAWARLIDGIGGDIEVETNGTIVPDAYLPVARYNCSPKLGHAGDPYASRIVPEALRALAKLARRGRAVMKVVVTTPNDVREAVDLARAHGFPLREVYVMPEGTTAADLNERHQWVAETAISEGVNMTTRLHVLAWGAERAR